MATRFAHFEFDPAADKLGEGPSSEVYRATDTRLGRTVALKILRPHVEFDPAAQSRFEREARHTSHLAHPNIATVYEYGQDHGNAYIAMEFLEGEPLDKILKRRRLDYDQGMRIALQVASALKLVHERGLIHRDLKPANVMVLPDGQVKLLDFGICRSTAEPSITQEGMLIGTVLYMSPEQTLSEELDPRSDVFSLGSVLYHAFTGELPFPGKSFAEVCMGILETPPRPPSEVREDFPPPLEEFLLRCLQRRPEDRPADGGEAHAALLAIADSLKLSASAERPQSLQGRLVIPPFTPVGDGEQVAAFCAGLRADLNAELSRQTQLQVDLAPEVPAGLKDAYVLRGSVRLGEEEAEVDYIVERARSNGFEDTTMLFHERVRHTDDDEWALQAKLVGSLLRSLKKRLGELALTAHPDEPRNPKKADRLAREAHELLHRASTRHLLAALSKYRLALAEDPLCVAAHAGYGEAMVRKFLYFHGDTSFLQEARQAAQRALTLDAFSSWAHTSLGFSSLASGDLEGAQRELRLAIQIDHENWLAQRLLGALLARLGRDEQAVPLLETAIELAPTHIASYDHLYAVLCRLDRYEEASRAGDRGIRAARRLLLRVPDNQEARLHLALLLARMGRVEPALEAVREARERFPKDAYTAYKAGCVNTLLGDLDRALELFREAQERGFHLPAEIQRNPDLEILRGRREFRELLARA